MNNRDRRKRKTASFLSLYLVLALLMNIVVPARAYVFPSVEKLVNEALEQTGMKDLVDDVARAVEDVTPKQRRRKRQRSFPQSCLC